MALLDRSDGSQPPSPPGLLTSWVAVETEDHQVLQSRAPGIYG